MEMKTSVIWRFLFVALHAIPFVRTIPIDNGVEGDPEVECGASGITVNFNVRNAFAGHVYVKGRFAEAGCRSDEGGRKVAGLQLPFSACGTERSRSLNPRGVFVRQNVVITFHPQFLTKVDRAYTIQCFYMEADKTVSQELEVSELTTLFHSQTVPMPVCRYDILENGPTGQPIKFALIGQQVFHKWTCDSETTDIFCMVVHSCFVDDGAGNSVQLLTDDGCGIDKHLLQNLEYTTDLMAGRESHVFKYADKAALFFQCQISITIKEPGAQCPRPTCPEPGGPGSAAAGSVVAGGQAKPAGTIIPKAAATPPAAKTAGAAKATAAPAPAAAVKTTAAAKATAAPPAPAATAGLPPPPALADSLLTSDNDDDNTKVRSKRSGRDFRADRLGVWDVRAQPITALDVDDDVGSGAPANRWNRLERNDNSKVLSPSNVTDYCLSPLLFGLVMAFIAISSLLTTVVCMQICILKSSVKAVV